MYLNLSGGKKILLLTIENLNKLYKDTQRESELIVGIEKKKRIQQICTLKVVVEENYGNSLSAGIYIFFNLHLKE